MKAQEYKAEISRLYWMAVDNNDVSIALVILKENGGDIQPRPIPPIDMRGTIVIGTGGGWPCCGD